MTWGESVLPSGLLALAQAGLLLGDTGLFSWNVPAALGPPWSLYGPEVSVWTMCRVDGVSCLRGGMALSFPHGPWWPGGMCPQDGHHSVPLPALGFRLKLGLGSEVNL